jgi:hypothetical protein
MRARRRSSKSKSSPWIWLAMLALALLVLLLWVAPVALASWARSRLQNDATRQQIEQFLGVRWKAQAQLDPLRWSGDSVSGAQVQVKADEGWQARLSGWRLGLDWAAFRAGRWRLMDAGADTLEVLLPALPKSPANPALIALGATSSGPLAGQATQASSGLAAAAPASDPSAPATLTYPASIPSWIRRWLPQQLQLESIGIETISLRDPAGLGLIGSRLRTQPWQWGEGSVAVKLEGGKLHSPLRLPADPSALVLSLDEAQLRLGRDEIILNSSQWRALDEAVLQCRGRYALRSQLGEAVLDLSRCPLNRLVAEDWRQRLSGWLEAQVRWKSQQPLEMDLSLKDATLTALPLLDQLAQFTKVERFRRLAFDQASAKYRLSGSTQVIESLVVEATGLMRLQGSVSIAADQSLQGDLMLGVTPETLQWIPGASQEVFKATPPEGAVAGLRWTPLRLGGTLKQPREDLTQRLLLEAGESLIQGSTQTVKALGDLLLPAMGEKPAAEGKPKQSGDSRQSPANPAVEKAVELLKGLGKGLLGP